MPKMESFSGLAAGMGNTPPSWPRLAAWLVAPALLALAVIMLLCRDVVRSADIASRTSRYSGNVGTAAARRRLRTLHPQSIQAYVVQLRVIATDTTSADFEIVTNIADGDALVKALRKDRALWVLSSFFAFTTHLGGAYVRMQAFKPGHDQTIAPVSSGALSAALSMLHVGAVSTYVVITATV